MRVEVEFTSEEDLLDKAPIISRVFGIPIVDRADLTLVLEADPADNLDQVRALQGVVSVEVT